MVQECLTNVQKHANASQVEVSFQGMDGGLEATVKDNGRGFDAREMTSGTAGEGMGLLSMRERAELLGGSLMVHRSPGSGSEIVLVIPRLEVGDGAHSSAVGG